MKNQNFYMRVISLLLVVLAVLFYNSSMKAQANEKEISALTDKVDTLQEQQNELLSALETSYANRMQNQAASTGTDSSNADSTDGDKAADTSDGKTSDANAEDTAAPDSDNVYKDGTYTGASTSTEWGDVQLQITVSSGKITNISALTYPNDEGKSVAINQEAIPAYTKEAISNQSADIQAISGATETYKGFTGSLQDAINQA